VLEIEIGELDFPHSGNILFGLCTMCLDSPDPFSTTTMIDSCYIGVQDNCFPSRCVAQLQLKKHAPKTSLLLVICFVATEDNRDDNWMQPVLEQHLKHVLSGRAGKGPGKKDLLVHVIHLLPKHLRTGAKTQPPDPSDPAEEVRCCHAAAKFTTEAGLFGDEMTTLSLDRPKPAPKPNPVSYESPVLRGHSSAEKKEREKPPPLPPRHCLAMRLRWRRALRPADKRHEQQEDGTVTFHYLLAESDGGGSSCTGSPSIVTPAAAGEYGLKGHVLWSGKALCCPWCQFGSGSEGYVRSLERAPYPVASVGAGRQVKTSDGSKKRRRVDSSSTSLDATAAGESGKASAARDALSLQTCGSLWSDRSSEDLAALLLHLRSFHGHFSYDIVADCDANLHVMVSRRDLEEESSQARRGGGFVFYGRSWRDMLTAKSLPAVVLSDLLFTETRFGEYMQRKVKRLQLSHASSSPPPPTLAASATERALTAAALEQTMAIASSDHTKIIGSVSDHARQYFHCNGSAVDAWEPSYESDTDASARWMHLMANDLLDDYQDISMREKAFMKLWNAFVNSFPLHADSYVRHGALLFARRMAPHIVAKELRHIFLVHLVSLWDFSLLTAADVLACVNTVDMYKAAHLTSLSSSQQQTVSSRVDSSSSDDEDDIA
jgi:hypothetical protein